MGALACSLLSSSCPPCVCVCVCDLLLCAPCCVCVCVSTNCGRYCQNDPDRDTSAGASGSDVVLEQLRVKCLWQYGNVTGNPGLWFQYVTGHDTYCAVPAKAPNPYDSACSLHASPSLVSASLS